MKKLKFTAFMMGAVLMSAGFTACSSDDDLTGDHIIIAPASPDGFPKTATVGNLIEFNYLVTLTDNKLAEVEVIINNEKEPKIVKFENKTSYAGSVSYEAKEVGTLKFSIIVTDNKGASATVRFEVEVEAAAGEIETYEAVLLGGNKHLTLGSFYSVSENKVFTIANAKANAANIDFAYYYGAENKATIAATSDAGAIQVFNDPTNGLSTWTTKKDTKFKKTQITAVQFDEIENDAEISILESISNSSATKLAENDVIAFETEEGKKGLFKITELKANSEGSITIIVKVQK